MMTLYRPTINTTFGRRGELVSLEPTPEVAVLVRSGILQPIEFKQEEEDGVLRTVTFQDKQP